MLTAFETVRCVLSLGYQVKRSSTYEEADESWRKHHDEVDSQEKADADAHVKKPYTPKPFDTSAVTLSKPVARLSELLAENAHDIWARAKLQDGWR